MSGPGVRLLGATVVGAAALAMAALSHTTFPVNRTDDSMLRLAWSARPERMESCRTLSEEELAALPQHMRQRVVCEGTTARYTLRLLRDGVLLDSAELRGGGLRNDRQLYVFREIPLPPGDAELEVRLTRVDAAPTTAAPAARNVDSVWRVNASTGADAGADAGADPGADAGADTGADATDGRDRRQEEEHRRRVEDEVPASLSLRETLTFRPREVVLVTYDQAERRLRLVRDMSGSSRATPR